MGACCGKQQKRAYDEEITHEVPIPSPSDASSYGNRAPLSAVTGWGTMAGPQSTLRRGGSSRMDSRAAMSTAYAAPAYVPETTYRTPAFEGEATGVSAGRYGTRATRQEHLPHGVVVTSTPGVHADSTASKRRGSRTNTVNVNSVSNTGKRVTTRVTYRKRTTTTSSRPASSRAASSRRGGSASSRPNESSVV